MKLKKIKYREYRDSFHEALKVEKLKLTPQRLEIFKDAVFGKEHRSCDEICTSLKSNSIEVSRATVYRTLDILIKHNFIRKMNIGEGRDIYESKIDRPHHDHMICIETGDIIEFYNEQLEDLQDEIAKKHGYEIIKHIHQLFVKPIKND